MGVKKIDNTTNSSELTAILLQDGGVIIKNFLHTRLLHKIQVDIAEMMSTTSGNKKDTFLGDKTGRISRLFERTDWIQEVALHPLYLETAQSILQKPVRVWHGEQQKESLPGIQIGLAQAIQIRPGQGAQPLHRDDNVWLWRHPDYGREARVQIMCAVSEFNEENGGTLVIPGSHNWDDERAPRREEAIPTAMDPGDALIWLGSTYHAGGENKSDDVRTGLTLSYDLATLRQEENQYLSIPISKMKEYPEHLQQLLGWSRSATYAGFVEHNGLLMDPLELLKLSTFSEVGCF